VRIRQTGARYLASVTAATGAQPACPGPHTRAQTGHTQNASWFACQPAVAHTVAVKALSLHNAAYSAVYVADALYRLTPAFTLCCKFHCAFPHSWAAAMTVIPNAYCNNIAVGIGGFTDTTITDASAIGQCYAFCKSNLPMTDGYVISISWYGCDCYLDLAGCGEQIADPDAVIYVMDKLDPQRR
jgi:hypothetical protein